MKRPEASEGPQRTCIGCGARKAQRQLVRLALSAKAGLVVDRRRRVEGRGAYLCGAGCLAAAAKRKALGRAFRGKAGSVELSGLDRALEQEDGVFRSTRHTF